MRHFTIAANTGEWWTRLTPSQVATETPTLSMNTAALVNVWDRKQNPQAIVRFCYQHVNEHILIHELVHAAQWIYRWSNPYIDEPAAGHFTFYNEQFAHLVSDLYVELRAGLDKRFTIEQAR